MTTKKIFSGAEPASEKRTIFVIHPSDLLTDNKANGDGLIASQFIQHLAERGHRLHVALKEADLLHNFPPNVTLYPIRCLVKWPLLARLEYMMRVRLLFEKLKKVESIDLLHQMNPVFTGLSLAFADVDLPLVLGTIVPRWPEEHSYRSYGWIGRPLGAARKLIAGAQQRFASVLLLTSPAALNRVPFPKYLADKIRFLQHGIDIQSFSPESSTCTSDPPESKRRPVVLFFTSLARRKGIFTLLDAFEILAAAMPTCELWIAGDGPEFQSVSERAKAISGGKQVRLLGNIPRAEVPSLLRRCTVYCLPSFGEPYGTTLLEAMSCGKPVAVTCTGGTPHFVPTDGGRLVPEDDPQALSRVLMEILRDADLQKSMGLANRNCIERNHSWTNVIGNLEQFYEEVLTEPAKHSGRSQIRFSST